MADKNRKKRRSLQFDRSDSQIMTLQEVADYLGFHHLTIYKLIQEKKIPAAKLGGSWRFKRDVLDKWIENDMQQRKAA